MKATKICKVCGEEYESCHTLKRVEGVYRWQDVACCPEHGAIYLEQVLAARGEIDTPPAKEEPVNSEVVEEAIPASPAPKKRKSNTSEKKD